MKKIIYFLSFLLVFVFTTSSFAQTKNPVQYADIVKGIQLPYPGLLPDNPFYFLKMARDRIVGIFISSPLKKIDFDVLQADKRLNAGVFLIARGDKKYQLALTTISKGENYFPDALRNINSAKQQGMVVEGERQKVKESLMNHEQILKEVENILPGSFKKTVVEEEKKIQGYENSVEK
jgi:hypothetical protein